MADKILQKDIEYIAEHNDWSAFYSSSILITGATGLIGHQLVFLMLYLNEKKNANIRIYALIRNLQKAKTLFENANIFFVINDIKQTFDIDDNIDYIIHGASITQSSLFLVNPVETIDTAYIGTKNILEFARLKQVKSVVYLSSMEVFGITDTKLKEVAEDDYGYIDILSPRSSYSESKRLCECLCASYFTEFGIPVKIARLTQTLGAGIDYLDTRVAAYFARCVIENKDIVLRTEGKMKRPCIYTRDAITGILTTLLKGNSGQAYNIANKSTFCSIRETAEMIAVKISKNKIKVMFEISNPTEYVQNLNLDLNLNTDKMESLGWKPEVNLEETYRRTIESMKIKKKSSYEY